MFINKCALLSSNACLYQTFDFREGSSACSRGNMQQMAEESGAAFEGISWCVVAVILKTSRSVLSCVIMFFYGRIVFPTAEFPALDGSVQGGVLSVFGRRITGMIRLGPEQVWICNVTRHRRPFFSLFR